MARLVVVVKDAKGDPVKNDLVFIRNFPYFTDENGQVVVENITPGSASIVTLRNTKEDYITIQEPETTFESRYCGVEVNVSAISGHKLFSVPVKIRYYDDEWERYILPECYTLLTDSEGVAKHYRLIEARPLL